MLPAFRCNRVDWKASDVMLKQIAVFNSHPIQHLAPWWQELARHPDVRLKVFYFSRANVQPTYDAGFGKVLAYDVDLLAGYDHSFLNRPWPFHKTTAVKGYIPNLGIRTAMREDHWDAVLVFGYAYLNNWIVMREARRLGIPILYFSDSNGRAESSKPKWKLALKRLLLRSFFRRISIFLCPGNSNMEYLRLYGVAPERMRLCPLPVDVSRFRAALDGLDDVKRAELRKRFQLAPDDFVITFSGKLYEGKRPQDLADAVRLLGDPRVKALFVGCGPAQEELRHRGGDSIRMAGFVNQQEIPSVLALGDLAVMPSANDAHPLAVTESLALGVPVLVSDLIGCHGPDDSLRDGENGFVYRCGDIHALAGLIRRLKEDPSLLASMKQRAVQLVETQTPQAAARAVLQCMESLKGTSPLANGKHVEGLFQKSIRT